uniref:AsIV-cont00022-ORF1 n=1 Tax=Apophua simplicipes ichnovirus TaxID=1329648 RepID=S5DMH1_9VIRU|nr:AsIV-cont00022-ORF1 [Apophua simplicipes ichnovirus]
MAYKISSSEWAKVDELVADIESCKKLLQEVEASASPMITEIQKKKNRLISEFQEAVKKWSLVPSNYTKIVYD